MSKITDYMKQHNNWKDDFKNLGIKINEDEQFYIFNYDIDCDFSSSLVQEARGIIIDKNTLEVVCWPFNKFFNYHEKYAANIDWSTARVQQKLDGSIVKLWFNKYTNSWQWSTNGVINAKNAQTDKSPKYHNFRELVLGCDNYIDIPWPALEKDKTYIFELVGPDNKVVIDYTTNHLYHIGTRSNITGKEYDTYLGAAVHGGFIDHPKEYSLNSLQDCLIAIDYLNGEVLTDEGFVVVDAKRRRIKIKTSEYLFYHRFCNNNLTKKMVIELLQTDDISVDNIIKQYPIFEDMINHYQSEIERIDIEVVKSISKARRLYRNCNYNRKAVVNKIKAMHSPYETILFRSLGNRRHGKTFIKRLTGPAYLSLIKDWEE